jgi:hypothetical protein
VDEAVSTSGASPLTTIDSCTCRHGQLEVDDRGLTYLHADRFGASLKAGKFRGDAVLADTKRDAITAALVGDREEGISGCDMHRGNGDARQDGAGAVGDASGKRSFLRESAARRENERAEQQHTSDHTSTVHGCGSLWDRDPDRDAGSDR